MRHAALFSFLTCAGIISASAALAQATLTEGPNRDHGASACENRALGIGFWRRQAAGHRHDSEHGHGRTVSADSLASLLGCVTALGGPFGPEGCFTADTELIIAHGHLDHRTRAARALLALELDRCAGLVCDSALVSCQLGSDREGDDRDGDEGEDPGEAGDDHHGDGGGGDDHGFSDMGPDHGPRLATGTPITVGDVIALFDAELCTVSNADSLEALASLAECAVESGPEHGIDHDGADLIRLTPPGTSLPSIRVAPMGHNPIRLSNGLGARFVLSAPTAAVVRFGIYDIDGRLVAELLRGETVTGSTVVRWDGTNIQGARVANGTYFYRATAGQTVATGRITVLH